MGMFWSRCPCRLCLFGMKWTGLECLWRIPLRGLDEWWAICFQSCCCRGGAMNHHPPSIKMKAGQKRQPHPYMYREREGGRERRTDEKRAGVFSSRTMAEFIFWVLNVHCVQRATIRLVTLRALQQDGGVVNSPFAESIVQTTLVLRTTGTFLKKKMFHFQLSVMSVIDWTTDYYDYKLKRAVKQLK